MNNSRHHVPLFHIRLPRGFLNDPNGPIEIDGVVHVYFQSRSRADMDVRVEWGHATSSDLVKWTLNRPALSPLPGGPDSDGCWSGNTVLHEGHLRAYYSGQFQDSALQSVLMAVSDDGGASFGAPTQVIDDPATDNAVSMFRDPFVWKEGDAWRMAVGTATDEATAAITQYRSQDGVHWQQADDLARLPRTIVDGFDTGEGWECPQIVSVDGRPVAVVSSWSHADGPARVLAFPLDQPAEPRSVDDGPNFYAASVMRDSIYGSVLFGWVTEGRSEAWWKEAGWAGAIALPRSVWMVGDRLATEPHPALQALRQGEARAADGARISAQAEILVPHATGRVRLKFGEKEHLDIIFDESAGTVTVDRAAASEDHRAHGGTATAYDAFDDSSGRPAARIFLDGSVIEVFTSSGRTITSRTYPLSSPPWTVEAPAGSQLWELR